MSVALLYERVRKEIAPYGTTLETATNSSDPFTIYIGFARAGTAKSDSKWIIFRVKDSGSEVTTRLARTTSTSTDQEQMNKIFNNASSYDYVE